MKKEGEGVKGEVGVKGEGEVGVKGEREGVNGEGVKREGEVGVKSEGVIKSHNSIFNVSRTEQRGTVQNRVE